MGPLFPCFTDLHRAEHKLVDSGIAIALPERVWDATASHMVARLAVPTTCEHCTDRTGATLATAYDEPISGVIVDAKPLPTAAAGPSETVADTSDGSSEM